MLSFLAHPTALKNSRKHRTSKPNLEHLEERVVLSFVDGFEGPTLDPFWTKIEISGFVTMPSTERAHGGSQSVKFTSTNSSSSKDVGLTHSFGTAGCGRSSIWLFDTGANQSSSNQFWFSMSNSVTGRGALLAAADYGVADGATYYYDVHGITAHVITRTQNWHQFTIDSEPTGLTLLIDGQTVYSSSEAIPFDKVNIQMVAPNWRPEWTSYWDDFEFQESGPDLAATSLAWDTAQAGVDFGYTISGSDLTQPTTAALYWSADTTFNPSGPNQDTLAYSTTTQTAVRTNPYPVHVDASALGMPPAGAKYLLAVLDPNNTITESNETNNTSAWRSNLSGLAWLEAQGVSQQDNVGTYANSTQVSDLDPSFRSKVENFISALQSAGATIDISLNPTPQGAGLPNALCLGDCAWTDQSRRRPTNVWDRHSVGSRRRHPVVAGRTGDG